jgi:hypothetical protein
MSTHGESGPTKDQLLSYYAEVCRSHDAITDFRAKLLALLPIASGAGIGLLLARADSADGIPDWLPAPVGLFGVFVTVGLFFYEFHQMDDCQQLRNHGVWIENELGICAGQFGAKRGRLGLRQIWPRKFRERDEKFGESEKEGKLHGRQPPPPGLVNVRNADYIVYGTVFLSWIFVLGWGIKGLAD